MKSHLPPLHTIATAVACLFISEALAQPTFTNSPALLPFTTHSGNCMAVTDMNGDGLDDIAVLDSSRFLRVMYQNIDGAFHGFNIGKLSNADQWGMAVADMDNDGHKDVFTGGNGDGQHYRRITAPGAATSGTAETYGMFMQNISIGDIDNDGMLDVFGCHDTGMPRTWMNDGSGNLSIASYIDFASDPPSDMSGNYCSVFTDFNSDGHLDLFIGKCRQGVNNPDDPRRWNRMFANDGTNQYTDVALEHGLQNRHQTWSADFGDWDNDGDLDLIVVNHDHPMQFFENDGNANFTEVDGTDQDIIGGFIQCHFEDFDNDGFLDILVAESGGRYLQGHGDGTFTPVPMAAVFPGGSALHSFGIGDLDNDGFMDVWASYGTGYTTPAYNRPDRLWLNNGNDNHWLNVRLIGVESNRDAVGARVTLTTALGTQVREVRAGESYGINNTGMCHFGLASHTSVPTLTVSWPSGQVDTYTNIVADQVLTLVEGTCIAPAAAISASALHLCPTGGAPVVLTASGGSSYAWSTGETSASIAVDATDYYTVVVDGGTPCAAMASLFISETPDITPVISSDVSLDNCWNTPITLTSTPANSYLWSTGETTQSITTTEEGDYTVTVDGTCPGITSAPVSIVHLPAPPAPVSADVNIVEGTAATLTAQGDSIVWYAAVDAIVPVGTESPWTTPVLEESTTYWCAEASQPVEHTVHGGMASPGTNASAENNSVYFPIFECYYPFRLKSVLVRADAAGTRLVGLVQWPGGTPIVSDVFDLPQGESRIDLNWDVVPGTYGLRMYGENIGVTYNSVTNTYPYPLGEVGAIVSTTNSGNGATGYFEIFYDWEVQYTTYTCEGPRTQVEVTVSPVGINERDGGPPIHVYPVPTTGALMLDLGAIDGAVDLQVMDIAGRIVGQHRLNGSGTRSIDVSGYAPGEYHLRITGGGRSERHRFVVH